MIKSTDSENQAAWIGYIYNNSNNYYNDNNNNNNINKYFQNPKLTQKVNVVNLFTTIS